MSEAVEVAPPPEPVLLTWAEVRVVRRVAPRWPEGHDRSEDAGCTLRVVFDPKGVPLSAVASGCDTDLGEAAVAAILHWRFAFAPGLEPAERSALEMRLAFPRDSVREGEIGGGLQVSAAGTWSYAGSGFEAPGSYTLEAGFWGSGGEGGLAGGVWHDGGQLGMAARAPLGRGFVAFAPGVGSSLRWGPAGLGFGFDATAGAVFNPIERGPTVGLEAMAGGWLGFRLDPTSGRVPSGWELGLRLRVGWRFRDRASGE